jgi:ribonuclease HI
LSRVKVYTDGASRGNPGESGIGIIIYDENGTKLKSWNEFTGTKTNNQAEYLALLKAAELLNELKNDVKISFIEFFADSQLMVKQMNLEYKVKDPGLKELFLKAQKLVNQLRLPYKFIHIERALNKEADKLANQGIDNKNIQL